MKLWLKNIFLCHFSLESFSDGVIAIVITLMIFQIKIPAVADNASTNEIWSGWLNLLPSLVAYMLSFVMVGVLWVNHHQFFHQLKNIDRKLLWYNLHLLFWMCIIPIPTAFLGQHFRKAGSDCLIWVYHVYDCCGFCPDEGICP